MQTFLSQAKVFWKFQCYEKKQTNPDIEQTFQQFTQTLQSVAE